MCLRVSIFDILFIAITQLQHNVPPYCTDIIAKHASDTTSSLVRATAVNAIMILLEEDKTHAVLRHLLPSLGNLIHDKTEKVRLAVIRLLLVVKKIRGMKYYHVVPAHHLLARLEEEGCGRNSNPTGPVAMGLTELLSNSFFPVGNMNNKKKKATTMNDIINRTLRLLTDNPGAALTFYRNASSQLSVGSISKLIAALMKCLVMLIEDEKKRTNNNCEDSTSSLQEVIPEDESREYRDANANIFQESNVALMATIAESISILWESVSDHNYCSILLCLLQLLEAIYLVPFSNNSIFPHDFYPLD